MIAEKSLSPAQVKVIRDKKGMFPVEMVMRQYGVTQKTVQSVWDGTYAPPTPPKGSKEIFSRIDRMLIYCAKGNLTAAELATRFNCDPSTIHNLWSSDSHIKDVRPAEIPISGKQFTLRLLRMLLEKPMKISEIAGELNVSQVSVYRGIRALKAEKFHVTSTTRKGDTEKTYRVHSLVPKGA